MVQFTYNRPFIQSQLIAILALFHKLESCNHDLLTVDSILIIACFPVSLERDENNRA